MTQNAANTLEKLRGSLIVSCQAQAGDFFSTPPIIAAFAQAAIDGGAAGIRANGVDDIRAIRKITSLPIIGIQKSPVPFSKTGDWLITGTFEEATQLVEAGADVIALDCSSRAQDTAPLERLARIKAELHVAVMADIATEAEARAAQAAGADCVSTTLRGYTAATATIHQFDSEFVRWLSQILEIPVIAEGRVATPHDAQLALANGAFAVVVGTAITSPREIARRFSSRVALENTQRTAYTHFLGIDMGGTNTKWGVVSRDGSLLEAGSIPTPAHGGRDQLLEHLKRVASSGLKAAQAQNLNIAAVGIATAGWVDFSTGRVAYATDNLPGWTGTPIAEELTSATGLPVAVENDANALALAELRFGAGRGLQNFVCITLGTGVGGGCVISGKLNRGAHYFANALGHITLIPDGAPCTCGKKGCLEVYANSVALLRAGEGSFAHCEELITAAHAGNGVARRAIEIFAAHLASGLASIVHALDPEVIILSGGLVEKNEIFLTALRSEMLKRVSVWHERKMQITISTLGYESGVLGAVGAILEKLETDLEQSWKQNFASPTSHRR